jgi:hypothetical protein
MKKTFILMLAALLVIAAVASATSVETTSSKTIIAGKVYDSPDFEHANGVSGANVNVTCKFNVLTTQSSSDGTYSVVYNSSTQCPEGFEATVVAEKNGIVSNIGTGKVHDLTAVIPDIYLGVVNVALIPEFGVFVGVLTLISAVAVFFVVRKK